MNLEILLQQPLDQAQLRLKQIAYQDTVQLGQALEIVQTMYAQMVMNTVKIGLAGLEDNYKEIENLLDTDEL